MDGVIHERMFPRRDGSRKPRRDVDRMHASGEPVTSIADALGVSGATVYRVVSEETGSSDTSP